MGRGSSKISGGGGATTKPNVGGAVQVVAGQDAVNVLNSLDVGTPLMVQTGPGLPYEQVIYVGTGDVRGTQALRFYDGRALGGTFGLSPRFISNGTVKVKLNDNDPLELAPLLKSLGR